MASEYLKWKYRDVKPDEPPPPLTGWPKVKNWLYYNKIWLIVAAVCISIVGSMLWTIFGRTRPDYIFAYVGKTDLPLDTKDALEEGLATLGEDVNGDGKVVVEVRSYITGVTPSSYEMAAAASVTLTADLTTGESIFFIIDDPEYFESHYQVLMDSNGAMPEDDDYSWTGRVLKWSDCPVLAALELGDYSQDYVETTLSGSSQELMSGLYIGRRGFYDGKRDKNREANDVLWGIITEGGVYS